MECKFCGKKDKKSRIEKHVKYCEKNPNKIPYKCKYCDLESNNYFAIASHTSYCKKNPNYENIKIKRQINGKNGLGRKHTDETKKKLSKIRIKYLNENPDKVPYLLNHSRKESYPEKYFRELFEKENIFVIQGFRISRYELDFSIPDKKICIEIDGEQHYLDSKILESDKRRTLFLQENGWDIIRIRWSEYQKMDKENKNIYIKNMKSYLEELILEKPKIEIIKKYKPKKKYKKSEIKKTLKIKNENVIKCKKCGNNCTSGKSRCVKCFRIDNRKVERPLLHILIKNIRKLGYVGTGKKYGVSDNTIRKWVKWYKKY